MNYKKFRKIKDDDAEKKQFNKKIAEKASRKVLTKKQKAKLSQKNANQNNNAELQQANEAVSQANFLRSPICCILGHVDTGKTKLLDKMRGTNIQQGECGGITQQIGATYFPAETLKDQCSKVDSKFEVKIPGLIIIDTPGHESFTNLRRRGSSLCDIAILVVDITKGIEQQTIEALELLINKKCPFIVALNKIDRCFGWKSQEFEPFVRAIKNQKKNTVDDFRSKAQHCMIELCKKAMLTFTLFTENTNSKKQINLVPTSAVTGQGIPDLLYLMVKLTQGYMSNRITLEMETVTATILDVKNTVGLGSTIDVLLIGGVLRKGDTFVAAGLKGPIVSNVKALLTPPPLRESRVNGEYIHHDEVRAAMGVKIAGLNLQDAIAGSSLYVSDNPEKIEQYKKILQSDVDSIVQSIEKSSHGVYVVASSLGSLEALLDFLKNSSIPVNNVSIGTVHKLDVVKASTMIERGYKEYAVILAFDVKIDPEALQEAANLGVTIFKEDIIYHLFDKYTMHIENYRAQLKEENRKHFVTPVIMKMLPGLVFNYKNPMIFGVEVQEGELIPGTPIYCPSKKLPLGTLDSIEHERKTVLSATRGMQVAVKFSESSLEIKKDIQDDEVLVSYLTRQSIEVGKTYFTDEVKKHLKLFLKLKSILNIT
uniref:Eukaryotic translation initiation factor 5B n=1 Tax=Dermatophagoides pteronyssinus TaxID=6956 RepID=A0A6P6XLV8_DERPT|nr:eukaryotic translation initiation factor 5B-like [Dermatophagoides pteronyssinus]